MIQTEEYMGESPSHLAFLSAAGDGNGLSGGGLRAWAAAGDYLLRLSGGAEGRNHVGGFSHESEHDLAVMVSDFLENGSGGGAESLYSSDSDSGFSDLNHLVEMVLFHKHSVDQYESDLLSVVHSLLLSIKEADLRTVQDGQCNASCIRHYLVKLMRFSGYDAAVCTSKWQGSGKVPGGDHKYIDVVFDGKNGDSKRLIVDIDFRSHFEIARAVESYDTILNSLPVVYVGSQSKLENFLQVMVDAAKCSLKQNSMPLPPWRSLSYLQAKWYSEYERNQDIDIEGEGEVRGGSSSDHRQCIGHLRNLKSSLQSEIENELLLKHRISDKKRRAKSQRLIRPPLQVANNGVQIFRG